MRNGRGPRGRFLLGGPAGPGRPRKGCRSPLAASLFEELAAIVDRRLSERAGLGEEEAIGAAELLVRHLRGRRAAGFPRALNVPREESPPGPCSREPDSALPAPVPRLASPEFRRILTLLRPRGGAIR